MTETDHRVLGAVRDLGVELKRPPLIVEVASKLRLGPQTVHAAVARLRATGALRRAKRYSRGLVAADPRCPLCDHVIKS